MSNIDDMHQDPGLDTLEFRREKHTFNQVYGAVNKIAPQHIRDRLTKVNQVHQHGMRGSADGKLAVPKTKLTVCRRSFFYPGPTIWNR